MSQQKLIERIHEKANKEIAQMKEERDLQLQQLEKEFEEKRSELESACEAKKENIQNTIFREVDKVFQKEKLKLDLELESFLSSKCEEYAKKILRKKWQEHSENFFSKYAKHYKKGEWEVVYVSVNDKSGAEKYFEDLEVKESDNIFGGFIAENKDGTFLVDNSLESRFEKIWPEILPEIIGKVYEKIDDKA